MPDDTIRLAEAAAILGVGGTTLKRWTEENRFPCVRTLGGHRRFVRADVLRWKAKITGASAATSVNADSDTPGDWLDVEPDPAEPSLVDARLRALRSRCADWAEAGDQLCAGVLTEIGERWKSGRMTCADEHAMSRALESALSRTAHAFPVATGAPVVVLACPAGERHTIGLTLVETVLRERGIAVRYLGADVPSRDLAAAILRLRPAAIGLSASICPRSPMKLETPARAASLACAETRSRLLLGGGANWPPTRGAVRFLTLNELGRSLDSLLRKPAVA